MDGFLAPVFVFLAHTVHIIGYEINGLSERVCALAKDLDGLLHEFDVVLVECTRGA